MIQLWCANQGEVSVADIKFPVTNQELAKCLQQVGLIQFWAWQYEKEDDTCRKADATAGYQIQRGVKWDANPQTWRLQPSREAGSFYYLCASDSESMLLQ